MRNVYYGVKLVVSIYNFMSQLDSISMREDVGGCKFDSYLWVYYFKAKYTHNMNKRDKRN